MYPGLGPLAIALAMITMIGLSIVGVIDGHTDFIAAPEKLIEALRSR